MDGMQRSLETLMAQARLGAIDAGRTLMSNSKAGILISGAIKSSRLWLFVNIAAILFYGGIEVWLRTPRSEEEALGGVDQKLYWLLLACPILFITFIANAVWLIRIASAARNGKAAKLLLVSDSR
jgi:hypothetical protein